MVWVVASTVVGLYCSDTSVVTIPSVSFTLSSNGLDTVWYARSSLWASLNEKKKNLLGLHFSFSFLLRCLMPKLMQEVPQIMFQTYLSVCSGAKIKCSSCKNVTVQNHKIGSWNCQHHLKQHHSIQRVLCVAKWLGL